MGRVYRNGSAWHELRAGQRSSTRFGVVSATRPGPYFGALGTAANEKWSKGYNSKVDNVGSTVVSYRLTRRQRVLAAFPTALSGLWFWVLAALGQPVFVFLGFGVLGFAAVMFWRSRSIGVDLSPGYLIVRRLRTVTIPWADVVGVELVRPGIGRAIRVRSRDRRRVLPAPRANWGRGSPVERAADDIVRFWVAAGGPSGSPDVARLTPRRRRRPIEVLQIVVTAVLAVYATSLLALGLLVAVIAPRPAVLSFLVVPALAGLVCCFLYPLRPRIVARWRRRTAR